MAPNDYSHAGRHEAAASRNNQAVSTGMAVPLPSEEEVMADVDEPPDEGRTPRQGLRLPASSTTVFSKTTSSLAGRKESLLTSALHSDQGSPTEEHSEASALSRGLSCASTWSNGSIASPAELTSDGGLTSPGTRTSTPSPPLPSSAFHGIASIFNKHPFHQPVSIVHHDDENVGPLQKELKSASGENAVEANLGRKRCISFASGPKQPAEATHQPKPAPPAAQEAAEAPKRRCTIKFACPTKVSTDAPSQSNKPRSVRPMSPAPFLRKPRVSPKPHRDSDSTVRNISPVSVRKPAYTARRNPSLDSDLAKSEAGRFHEFASSEEEVDEWVQESTCHRSRLTIGDTLKIENNLRQLGEEAEEEALEDEQDDDEDHDDDDDLDEDEEEDEDTYYLSSDEGFQTDDEEGFAGSDDESDAGSDYQWWNPGYSTAATSMEHLEHIRPGAPRSVSESSIGSVGSAPGFSKTLNKSPRRKKARPVNIRVPSPGLPDSTDFVCGTLDEDRPLEAAYLSCLERRRAAKHKATPQDIDPSFPTSDPELEEDEDDDEDEVSGDSDQHPLVHGQMEPHENREHRGRHKDAKRPAAGSPKRLRSPPPMKRTTHRSPPPPRRLFTQSPPKRLRSPAPIHLRSPPPTRRPSQTVGPKRAAPSVRFAALAQRSQVTMSSSAPRTPVGPHPGVDMGAQEDYFENPTRRAIDIKIGLENRRLRRKEKLYQKTHRKGCAKDKKPPPGKGCERMREMGLGLAAHKGKSPGFNLAIPATPDQKDLHVLSV